MFIKIEWKNENISIFECSNFSQCAKGDKGDFDLILEPLYFNPKGSGLNEQIIHIKTGENKASVYVLNNQGKTIDVLCRKN